MAANARQLAAVTIIAVASLALAIAYAHVMTYYPTSVTVSPTAPEVGFAPGSNAGGADIGVTNGNSNTITVTIGQNATSLELTVHPTYQTTYYQNITLIENNSTLKSYSVSIEVASPLSLPSGSKAYLIIYSKGATRSLSGWPIPTPTTGTYIAEVDLTSTGTTAIGTISSGGVWEVDLLIYIPEGVTLPSQQTAELYLIATPSS